MSCSRIKRPVVRGDTLQFAVQVYAASAALGLNHPYTAGTVPPYCDAPPARTAPQPITGWFAFCTLKRNEQDSDSAAVYQATSQPNGGIVFVSPSFGQLQVTIPARATFQFPDGDVPIDYDIQLVDPAGQVWTVELGSFVVDPDITRTIAAPPPAPAPPFAFLATQIYLVASASVLGLANAAGLPSGALAYVPNSGSGGYYWMLDHQSTLTPSATVIAAVPAGTGNWVRSALGPT